MKAEEMRRPLWQQQGREPDYRFSLANERTFLAWLRTALALLAGAVVLDQVSTRYPGHGYVAYLAVSASMASAAMCLLAFRRWKVNEIAMRHGQPLSSSLLISGIAVGFMMAAISVAVVMAVHR